MSREGQGSVYIERKGRRGIDRKGRGRGMKDVVWLCTTVVRLEREKEREGEGKGIDREGDNNHEGGSGKEKEGVGKGKGRGMKDWYGCVRLSCD